MTSEPPMNIPLDWPDVSAIHGTFTGFRNLAHDAMLYHRRRRPVPGSTRP